LFGIDGGGVVVGGIAPMLGLNAVVVPELGWNLFYGGIFLDVKGERSLLLLLLALIGGWGLVNVVTVWTAWGGIFGRYGIVLLLFEGEFSVVEGDILRFNEGFPLAW
jgi:hypothetical protein